MRAETHGIFDCALLPHLEILHSPFNQNKHKYKRTLHDIKILRSDLIKTMGDLMKVLPNSEDRISNISYTLIGLPDCLINLIYEYQYTQCFLQFIDWENI
jgi:hypothetical protein